MLQLLGMLSAAASQGLVYRWDIDGGLAACDRFLYVQEDFIKVRSVGGFTLFVRLAHYWPSVLSARGSRMNRIQHKRF